MSKIKVSFSLLFAIFLVGILSTAAFAHSAYNLSVSPDSSGGFNFSFDKSFQPDDPTTAFTLNVYAVDPVTQTIGATAVFTKNFTYDAADANSHKVDVTKTSATPNIAVGTVYDFVLLSGGQVVGEKLGALTDSHNLKLANVADLSASGSTTFSYTKSDGKTVTIDVKGSGLVNSNHTGADKKGSKNQKGTHGFYSNNTNSCASCHQAHTSDDASGNLLMKSGAYSTCTSCHDGTTGGYNAFEAADESTADSIAGTFNVTMDGNGTSSVHNGSIHDADGSLKVTAAPGGNTTATSGPFNSSFDCASCHNPHGGGSAVGSDGKVVENNLSQDPLGWGAVPYASASQVGDGTNKIAFHSKDGSSNYTLTKDNEYGKLYMNPTIYTPGTIPGTNVAPYIFVLNTAGVDVSTLDQTSTEYYYLNRDHYQSNSPILQTYRWQKGGYVPDFSLWLQEKGYPYKADTALYNADWSTLTLNAANNYSDGSKDITRASDVKVEWKDGFAWGTGVANVKSIQVSLGVDVETTPFIQTLYQTDFTGTVTNKDNSTTSYSYIPDSGVEMSKYCASCHTDYLSASRNDNTGVYTTAHRHMTLADETNCIRCHYGHGTDATIMHDANDNTQFTANGTNSQTHSGDLSYYKDPNYSSALKRYTGMSVCYACHGQGEQFLSNPNNVERPIFGQPGTTTRNADPTKAGE